MEPRNSEVRTGAGPTAQLVEGEGLEPKVKEMVDRGLVEMEKKYGEESDDPKNYHNEKHVLRIEIAVELIGKEEGLSDDEIGLLRVAAAWHDVELGLGVENENESARLCQNEMDDKRWGQTESRVVGELIRATKFIFDKDGVIFQMVGNEPEELYGKYKLGLMKRIIADADISACGADWDACKSCGMALGRGDAQSGGWRRGGQ